MANNIMIRVDLESPMLTVLERRARCFGDEVLAARGMRLGLRSLLYSCESGEGSPILLVRKKKGIGLTVRKVAPRPGRIKGSGVALLRQG